MRFAAITGLITLFAFAGDMVVDSLPDACCDHCTSQSSQPDSPHDTSPCPHSSCAAHNGSLIASSCLVNIGGDGDGSRLPFAAEPSGPEGIPPAIDHPPQLA